MKKISLKSYKQEKILSKGYDLDPTEEYVINFSEEMDFQLAIMNAFQMIGYPPAIKNYYAWLYENGFSIEAPNPTNEFVAPFYGKKPLWETPYSQGIVVKAEEDETDYYIVMECSDKNKGFKHTKVILTLGGCV